MPNNATVQEPPQAGHQDTKTAKLERVAHPVIFGVKRGYRWEKEIS